MMVSTLREENLMPLEIDGGISFHYESIELFCNGLSLDASEPLPVPSPCVGIHACLDVAVNGSVSVTSLCERSCSFYIRGGVVLPGYEAKLWARAVKKNIVFIGIRFFGSSYTYSYKDAGRSEGYRYDKG